MPTISSLLELFGGVIRTGELLRAGINHRQIAAAVHGGDLIRARQGCFVRRGTSSDVERAIRVGGRLTSFSALASYGLAVPETFPLHVHVAANAARLRAPDDRFVRLERQSGDAVIHHHQLKDDATSDRARVSLIDALLDAARDGEAWDAVAAIDSARHRCLLDLIDLERLRRYLPESSRWMVTASSDAVGEYVESVTRVKLLLAGVSSLVQVNVLDERWIDLLVGDRLALECDGRGKYERGATVTSDRQRDAFLEALGYHVIRLSYAMVMHDWEATLSMILAVMERRHHLA